MSAPQDLNRASSQGPIVDPPEPSADPPADSGHSENGREPKPIYFSRANLPRTITVKVQLPIIRGLEFLFDFKLALSAKLQEEREEWLGMRQAERLKTYNDMTLRIVADLLVRDPLGFDPSEWPGDQRSPGEKLLAYYEQTTDPDTKKLVFAIIEAASTGYWAEVTPLPFPA